MTRNGLARRRAKRDTTHQSLTARSVRYWSEPPPYACVRPRDIDLCAAGDTKSFDFERQGGDKPNYQVDGPFALHSSTDQGLSLIVGAGNPACKKTIGNFAPRLVSAPRIAEGTQRHAAPYMLGEMQDAGHSAETRVRYQR